MSETVDSLEAEIKILRHKLLSNKIGKMQRYKLVGKLQALLYELESRRVRVIDQQPIDIEVEWSKIQFWDGYIKAILYGVPSEKFISELSRQSFEYIKPSIQRHLHKPLKLKVSKNRILAVENLSDLTLVLQFLSVHDEVCSYFKDRDYSRVTKILKFLKPVSNSAIIDFYQLNRNEYLSYLCKKQFDEFKIIPVIESAGDSWHSSQDADGFIFTIMRQSRIYLIWESTHENKATYIFKATRSDYEMDTQRLFDFISSNQKQKRTKIRSDNRHSPLNYTNLAIHSNLLDWRLKIKKSMG